MNANNNFYNQSPPMIAKLDHKDSQNWNNEGKSPYLRWSILGFLFFIAFGAVSYSCIFQNFLYNYIVYLDLDSYDNIEKYINLYNVNTYANLVVPFIGGILVSTLGVLVGLISSISFIVLAAIIGYIGISD